MSPLHATVLWCGVVSHAPEITEFGCEGCSLTELLLVGTRNAPAEPPRSWHMLDFAPIGNRRAGRPCGGNNNVQELNLRHALMRMRTLEDHEIFDAIEDWARVEPGSEGARYDADFDGRLCCPIVYEQMRVMIKTKLCCACTWTPVESRCWTSSLGRGTVPLASQLSCITTPIILSST